MTGKNRYFRRSKISAAKFRQIIRHFALDLTATECAALTGVSVRSVNDIYLRIRRSMNLKECEFRFNHRHQKLYLALLKLLREHPL